MSDPRGMVKTDRVGLVQEWRGDYFHIMSRVDDGIPCGDWPELVAFAEAILAANREWLDSQTPSLDELRERYLRWKLDVLPHDNGWIGVYDSRECAQYGDDRCCRAGQSEGLETEAEALRWLAAELAREESNATR